MLAMDHQTIKELPQLRKNLIRTKHSLFPYLSTYFMVSVYNFLSQFLEKSKKSAFDILQPIYRIYFVQYGILVFTN